jgi:hypothetical protein
MTDVGEVKVKISVAAAGLTAGLSAATAQVKEHASEMADSFEHVARVLENFGIYVAARDLIEFGKSALESADNLYILSQRTGIAVETFSALNVPLQQNGSNVEEFARAVKFLSSNIELASEGNQVLVRRFDSLGLSVAKLKALSPENQLLAVAQALGQTTDQGQLTANVLELMGRGSAALIPILKESGGNLQEFIEKAKEAGNTLTAEDVAKVHEYDDAWVEFVEHLKVKAVEAAIALDQLAHSQSQLLHEDSLYGVGGRGVPSPVSDTRPNTVNAATFIGQDQNYPAQSYDPNFHPSAKGGNSDLLTPSPEEQLGPYIQSLNDEADALGKSKLALAEYRAEKQGAMKAAEDFKNGLRDSKDLTDDELSQIDAATDAYEEQKDAIAELQKEEQKHIQMVAEMEAQISSSLADIAVNYKSLGATVTSVLQQIAKQIIEMKITTPLVEAIGGTKGSPGLLSGLFGSDGIGKLLGFAAGGSPPVGVPSIVGENGPEIFVPNTAGTVVPNNKLGGQTVLVQQSINLSPGLAETVNAAIMNSAPAIAAMAHKSVISALQRGGDESRIAGIRN